MNKNKTSTKKMTVKSLKIDRKKKTKRVKRSKKKLTIKQVKFERTIKKLRTLAKRIVKSSTKNMKMTVLPENTYKKIDMLTATNDMLERIVQAAVSSAIDAIPENVKDGTRKPRRNVRKKSVES